MTLCDAQGPWGASWGPNDRIVFGQGAEGIWQVSAAGGTKETRFAQQRAEKPLRRREFSSKACAHP